MYNPADTDVELRWCMKCRKWLHTSCVDAEDDDDLQKAKVRGQKYILLADKSLWARVISQPIRRVSREHKAPLSLEKLQRRLISKWTSGQVIKDQDLMEEVRKSGLFDGEIPDDFLEMVEVALTLMGTPEWMTCPICKSYYI